MRSDVFEGEAPADYLARLAALPFGKAYKSLALRELAIAEGHVVVDLGCGPGADLEAFAAATGPSGAVIGVDSDPEAVRAAVRSQRERPWVQGQPGDIHSVVLPDAGADRVHADRVLQHVADPARAVGHARRLLRAGGRAVFAEPDYDTLVVDHPDAGLMRAYRRFVVERVIRNPGIGRQLARLATDAGFGSTRVVPVTSVFDDVTEADKVFGFERVTRRAVAAGYLDPRAAEA